MMKVYALLVHAYITYNFEEIEKEKIKSHLFSCFQNIYMVQIVIQIDHTAWQ